jgi:hypothetical protein
MLDNREKIFRYAFVPQFLAAVTLLAVAYLIGKADVHLLLNGARTRGKVVGFQRTDLHTHRNPSSNGMYGRIVYLPVVEFEVQGTIVKFEEHKLVSQGEGVGSPVAVLYDPANVSRAMVDRPFWNWIPWAPALAIGVLLALASLKGLFSLAVSARIRSFANPTQTN